MNTLLEKISMHRPLLIAVLFCFYVSNVVAAANIDNPAQGCYLYGSTTQTSSTRFTVTVPYSFTDLHPDLVVISLKCHLKKTDGSAITGYFENLPIDQNTHNLNGQKTIHFSIGNTGQGGDCPVSQHPQIYGEHFFVKSAECSVSPGVSPDGNPITNVGPATGGGSSGGSNFAQQQSPVQFFVSPTENTILTIRSTPTPVLSDQKDFP